MARQRIPVPTEAQEQTWLFEWLHNMQRLKWPELELAYHIPNGGSRNKIEAANLKKQGVNPGIPDICIPIPKGNYHGLYIEMKRQKYGELSEDQKQKIKKLRDQGYCAVICKGFQMAADVVELYMQGRIIDSETHSR